MSTTQEQREAAARAWYDKPTGNTYRALAAAIEDGVSIFTPDGRGDCGTLDAAVSRWLAWAKDDAAKPAPAPVDALDGVVWETPGGVVDYTTPGLSPQNARPISNRDRDLALRIGAGHGREINAHARAQLAREAAKPAPAMTLEQATTAALAAELERRGATVTLPKVGGYERPDLALAQMEAWRDLSDADRVRMIRVCGAEYSKNQRIEEGFDAEIARLRALGVTPAVLS